MSNCGCCSGETSITSTQGEKGDTGLSGTITIGTVTTGAAGSSATVTNSGSLYAAVLNFTIPQGLAGSIYESVIDAATSTQALTEAQSGSIVYLNRAAGVAVTLPSSPTVGTNFTFIVRTTVTSNVYSITSGTAANVYEGYIVAKKAATVDTVFGAAAPPTNTVVSMNGSTTGGIIGTRLECVYVSTNRWVWTGETLTTGATASPFA